MALTASAVQLSLVRLTPAARRLRARREARMGQEAATLKFPDYEWRRISYVARRLKGGPSLLEVGPGKGYLSRMIAKGGLYPRQEVVDIVAPSKAVEKKFGAGVIFRQMSVADLPDPDRSFDTVLCMEVLEHLEDDVLPAALAQIRRVCARRLIMSVPFAQPLPLPSYHKQRFDADRLLEMFPKARFTLLFKEPVTRWPWMLIEERMDSPR